MKEYKLNINGKDFVVKVTSVDGNVTNLEVNGKSASAAAPIAAPAPAAAPVAAPKAAAPAGAGVTVNSPLPGVILEVSVKEGDVVKKGQKVMLLEAMKMENVIEATADGTVTSIKVNKGDSILEGAPLLTIA
ncbi:MAG: biotin/lipoyl-binding protein [Bacteroidales bacterium]|nr:biotin/lipoyl-binding protein [Candidatus Egerieousia equi]